MEVNLVSITRPVSKVLEDTDPEGILVYIARVSSSRQDKTENPGKLIGYLIDHKHWSPFEMVSLCVEIVTSRAIAQQILRHRSFCFQELSQRYTSMLEMEPVELRKQAEKNRQSSTDVVNDGLMSMVVTETLNQCRLAYETLLSYGVAKECARMVLPMTTQTRLYMQGTLRSWIHYLQIRDDAHAQLEHQRIAQAIKAIVCEQFPYTTQALGW